jgi:Raf kinase inhibitor-like YbhB/YbcL family protein
MGSAAGHSSRRIVSRDARWQPEEIGPLRSLLGALCIAGVLAGCATNDGRELREPKVHTTASLPEASPGAGFQANTDGGAGSSASSDRALTFALGSQAIEAGGQIPKEFTCDGAGTSPPLDWTGVPLETAELAIVMVDSDADDFVHWVVAGLHPTGTGIELGSVPPSAVQAFNSFGDIGYGGPCPPPGETHTYLFTIYALPEPLGLAENLDTQLAVDLIRQAAIYPAFLTTEYTRPG